MNALLLGLIAAAVVYGAEVARRRPAFAVPVALVTLLVALRPAWNIAHTYVTNVTHFQKWDYLCFWLYGRSLALHLDPYGAHALAAIPLAVPIDAEFRREVLAVGTPYPPWSLALFRPLGMFSEPHRGAGLWCAVEFVALLGACVVIARWRTVSINRLVTVSALVVLLPPALATAILSQTIPLTLLFLALYVLRIERSDGGVWLAAAAVVKPFLLLLFLVPLARRLWRQLAAAVATLAVMSLAGSVLAGPAVFVNYLRENPIPRMPGSVITEANNVPIVAYILRWTHVMPPNGATLPPSLVALDLVLLLVGSGVAWLALDADVRLAACSLVVLSLLLYPQTGAHYAVLLALPLVLLWRHPVYARRPGIFAAFAACVYVLLALDDGHRTMFASLLVWMACAFASLRTRGSLRERTQAKVGSRTKV